jgi:hypothetical protein
MAIVVHGREYKAQQTDDGKLLRVWLPSGVIGPFHDLAIAVDDLCRNHERIREVHFIVTIPEKEN